MKNEQGWGIESSDGYMDINEGAMGDEVVNGISIGVWD